MESEGDDTADIIDPSPDVPLEEACDPDRLEDEEEEDDDERDDDDDELLDDDFLFFLEELPEDVLDDDKSTDPCEDEPDFVRPLTREDTVSNNEELCVFPLSLDTSLELYLDDLDRLPSRSSLLLDILCWLTSVLILLAITIEASSLNFDFNLKESSENLVFDFSESSFVTNRIAEDFPNLSLDFLKNRLLFASVFNLPYLAQLAPPFPSRHA